MKKIQTKNINSTNHPNTVESLKTIVGVQDRDASGDQLGYKVIQEDFDFTSIPASYADSIWEIRYEHDLGGGDFVVPAGVVLFFNGGIISNYGTITGNLTKIDSVRKQIFDTSGAIAGTWGVNEAFPEWFMSESNVDNSINVLAIKNAYFICDGVLTFEGSKSYGINDELIFSPKNIELNLNGCELVDNIADVNNNSIIEISQNLIIETTLASNISEGDNQIVVNDVTGVSVGDGVRVTTDELIGTASGVTKLFFFVITEISGNTITLNGNVLDSFSTTFTDVVRFYKLYKIDIRAGKFNLNNEKRTAILLNGLISSEITGNTIIGNESTGSGVGITANMSSEVKISNNNIFNCDGQIGDGIGYGVSVGMGCYMTVSDNNMIRCKHGATGFRCYNCYFINNKIFGEIGNLHLDLHDGCYNSILEGNVVMNGGITIRTYKNVIVANNILQKQGTVLLDSDSGNVIENVLIHSNVIEGDGTGNGFGIDESLLNCFIRGNTVRNLSIGINITVDISDTEMSGNIIDQVTTGINVQRGLIGCSLKGNVIKDTSSEGIYLQNQNNNCSDCVIEGNECKSIRVDNTLTGLVSIVGNVLYSTSAPLNINTSVNTENLVFKGNVFNAESLGTKAITVKNTTELVLDGFGFYTFAPASATDIDNIIGGRVGDEVTILFFNGNTTLKQGTYLKLDGGIDFNPASLNTVTFKCHRNSSISYWYEISRKV